MSQEVKDKISNSRKFYLKNNPEKHPWKRKDKFISAPCEYLKKYFNDNKISFIEEWQPLEDRFFSIDIAFPDIKFGLEINGNQHYNRDGTLKPYYQERHDLIEDTGWKLWEIHYSQCYNPDKILKAIELGEQPDYTQYIIENLKRKDKPKGKTRQEAADIRSAICDLKWEPYKEIILNCGIDFSKYGWVGKIAEILKIKPQKVCWWMRKYLPDFYKNNCYVRKFHSI